MPAYFDHWTHGKCISSTSSTGFVESNLSGVDVYNGLLWMLKELYQAPPYKSCPASEVGALNKLCKFSRKDNNRECGNSVILWGLVQAQDVTTCFSECKKHIYISRYWIKQLYALNMKCKYKCILILRFWVHCSVMQLFLNSKNECMNFDIFEIENTGKHSKLVTNLSQIYHAFYKPIWVEHGIFFA